MNKGIKMAIIILIVLVFLYFVYAFFTVTKEGMETNEYAYLEPVTPENAVTDDTMDKLIDFVVKKRGIKDLTESQKEADRIKMKKDMKMEITEKMAQYYLANDNFPINKFTQNYEDYIHSLPESKNNRFPALPPRNLINYLWSMSANNHTNTAPKSIFDGLPENKILGGATVGGDKYVCVFDIKKMQKINIDDDIIKKDLLLTLILAEFEK